MTKTPKKKGWRWGWARWVVLAAILLGLYLFTGILGNPHPVEVVMPHVVLPAEELTAPIHLPVLGEFYLTNTMTALLLADLVIVIIAIAVSRAAKRGNLVPRGLAGAVEALLEALHNITESTAGKWTKVIFPWFATITLLVLVANWTELFPGIETIGVVRPSAESHYQIEQVGSSPFYNILEVEETEAQAEGETAAAADAHAAEPVVAATDGHAEAAAGEEAHTGYAFIPFVRVVSTDLNFTVALALVAVFMVQVVGIRAQGGGYFLKFWNTKTMFSKPIFGVVDFGVGILELVSEFSKILSFAFRLFGNIFAGSVLLFVIGSLVPVFAQSVFYLLEFFVGLIQAVVFGMLTMVFMAQATQGHGGEHHEEAHA